MFESMDEPSPEDSLDEQPLQEWLDEERFEELVAADPERPRMPAAILADATTLPVTPQLVEDLATIDPTALPCDEDRLTLAAAWDRAANYAHAQRGAAVAAIVAAETPNPVIEARQITTSLVAETLAVGMGTADSITAASVALATRLHATHAEVLAGNVAWDKAAYLAGKVSMLTDKQALAVEARVLPAAGRRTWVQHVGAVRRAVDRVDPVGAASRRKQMQADVGLVCRYYGDGMGDLLAVLPVEQLDTIFTAAEAHARRAKAAGDERTLEQLYAYAIYTWAVASLTGEPSTCGPEPSTSEPTRHGKRATVQIVWDLTSLLGVTAHCAELADSGETIPPAAMRTDVLPEITRVRRLLIEPEHGVLIDLTPRTWPLPTDTDAAPAAYLLNLVVETWQRDALLTGDITGLSTEQVAIMTALQAALADCDPELLATLTAVLADDLTAESLDDHPDSDRPSAALAEFVCVRDRHPINPCAGPTSATAGDLDHTISRAEGGKTTRANLGPLTRRWHRLKTFGGWHVRRHGHGWEWTSPTGRRHHTYPHDYRLGP